MQHLDVVSRKQRLLRLVGPDAVRDAEMWRGETDLGEILEIVQPAGEETHNHNLLARFRRMRVYECLVLSRQACHGFEEIARAGNRKPRRERSLNPSVAGAVPL